MDILLGILVMVGFIGVVILLNKLSGGSRRREDINYDYQIYADDNADDNENGDD